MINLVGCTKENFTKLLILMNYKKENNKSSVMNWLVDLVSNKSPESIVCNNCYSDNNIP